MIPDRRRPSVPERALQEYLEVLHESTSLPLPKKTQMLMMARAELEYQLRGGSECSMCETAVRHLIPVLVERYDGTRVQHRCLCRRCLEAEKAVSMMVTLRLGEACVIFTREPEEAMKEISFSAAAD
ncbi:MAG: hypothetical protein ACJ71N_02865 [Terriglobales bacterium]